MKHHQHRASVLLESLNPGDRFRFCFESNNFIYEKGEQVGKFIEVKQVIPAAGTPEVFYRNTLVIKFIKMTRQTGQRKKAINSGKRVCVTYPNAAAKYGVTTSDANKYSRIGVCFDDGTWGYVHIDFVSCAMKHPPPPRIRRPKPKPLTKREFSEQYKRAEILLAAAEGDGEKF